MGKDQELLEAARSGNLQAVKTILSGKLPRTSTGGWRSLWALKSLNINCTDASGETPLHLAALYGHSEVVSALLGAKASVTEVDSKGCTPLHLAAWNGHANICELLLQHAADKSIVNVQTTEGETPLHFAAQHGHLEVVSLLLQNKADPTYRTLAERSALDLAAQYGKTDVVRTLVTGRHELLTHVAGQPSPLHLAAFNGHLPIVGFLLDSGFPVNTRRSHRASMVSAIFENSKTDNGTALHEAATSCKLDVIKLLLDRGVDVWAKAKNDMTAEDILKSIHSKLTHEALQIISGHVNSQRTPDSDGERDMNGIPGPGSATAVDPLTGTIRPIPKPRSVFIESHGKLPGRQPESSQSNPGEPHSPPPPLPPRISLRQVDTPYREVTPVTDTGQVHLLAEKTQGTTRSRDASPGCREQPKKPPRKTPSMRKTENPQHSSDASTSSEPLSASYDKPLPPPPCDTDPSHMDYVNVDLDKISSSIPIDDSTASACEADQTVITESIESGGGDAQAKDEMNETEVGNCEGNDGESGCGDSMTSCKKRESIYANATMIAEEEAKINKPQSLELEGGKRKDSTNSAAEGGDQPASPNSYAQPPTPDCPPPSPSTALQGIQQKINPQDKRKSKDMETITESTLLQAASGAPATADRAAQPKESAVTTKEVVVASAPDNNSPAVPTSHGEQHLPPEPVQEKKPGNNKTATSSSSTVMTMSDGGVQHTVQVEGEVVEMRRSVSSGDHPIDWESNVFAGLLKGSTPGGSRNVVSQICENVVVKTVRSKHRSTPSTIVTFDPLMEREEDRDVFDADKVLDEIDTITGQVPKQSTPSQHGRESDEIFDDSEEWAKIAATLETFGAGIARESVFVREYEASFTKSLAAGHQKIQSVGEWLESFGLGQYENTLVANGFDDTDFLGGTIIEDQDLAAIGITNESHRMAVVTAAHRLPPVEPINQKVLPDSVEKWLETLHLGQYLDTFLSHKYNTMQRVIKLWELELNTVLDISSLGHRKRILASLGDRPHAERDKSLSPVTVRARKRSDENEPKSPFEHIDLYHDYTGVKPQGIDNGEQRSPVPSPLLSYDRAGENGPKSPQAIRDSQIHIRPPHLMHTTGSIKQWRHRPEVLIKGCCNYTAHYLGSTVVKELKGTTSTKEGIAKLKKSTEVINKIPTIMLSISYKGVKFIDAKSKKVICDHEIANIFCACQDGDHMNFFAYVTKDKETSRHYCHVFSVRSREQAGEIILTLGEAFEIAYQMALKERAEEDAVVFEQHLSQSDQDDTTSVSSKASVNTV